MILTLYLLFYCGLVASDHNKYSKEVNEKHRFDVNPEIRLTDKENPYASAKLNFLWTKARMRLSESKLKSLYSELKVHDKEELAYKRFKATHGDADGTQEEKQRKRLIGIMSTYNLLEHFQDVDKDDDNLQNGKKSNAYKKYVEKTLFKDKKLNKLWSKAVASGFSDEELNILKDEFDHHQKKIDDYFSLLNNIDANKINHEENTLDEEENNVLNSKIVTSTAENEVELLRSRHLEIKHSHDRLERLTGRGPNYKEFIEPKVQQLWTQALSGNFTPDELASLNSDLQHYEKRLFKLRHLHSEAGRSGKENNNVVLEDKTIDIDFHDMIKKNERKVEKLHERIYSKISARTEL